MRSIVLAAMTLMITLGLSGMATAAQANGLDNPAFDNTTENHPDYCDGGHYTHTGYDDSNPLDEELRFCFQEDGNGPVAIAIPGQEENVNPGNGAGR